MAVVVQSYVLLLFFFEPGLRYKVWNPPAPNSPEFLNMLQALLGVCTYRSSRVDVLTNGNAFYASELDAIRAAQKSINLEAYIFQEGELTLDFVTALAERARLGVKVNLVIDAVGSAGTSRSYFQELFDAGGRVARYHPFGWATVARFNNRTHRVLLVIDGKVGELVFEPPIRRRGTPTPQIGQTNLDQTNFLLGPVEGACTHVRIEVARNANARCGISAC